MTEIIDTVDTALAAQRGVEAAVYRWLSDNPAVINDAIRAAIGEWLDYTPNHGLR